MGCLGSPLSFSIYCTKRYSYLLSWCDGSLRLVLNLAAGDGNVRKTRSLLINSALAEFM